MADTALELPTPLRSILGTLMCNNILSSWNIYSSGHNVISVNIRFSQPAIAGNEEYVKQPVYYRKQSRKQVTHNKARAHAYKHRQDSTARTAELNPSTSQEYSEEQPPPPPPSAPPHPSPPKTDSKKRKIDTLTPETFRLDTTELSTTTIDSPDKPSDTVAQPPDSPTSPTHVDDTRFVNSDDGTAVADGDDYCLHPPVIPLSPPLSNPSFPILSPPDLPPEPPDPLEEFGRLNPELMQWYRTTFKR